MRRLVTYGSLAVVALLLVAVAAPAAEAASCKSICGQGRGVCKRAAKLVRDAARETCNSTRDACREACPTCEEACTADGDACRTACADAGDPQACVDGCNGTQDACIIGCATCEDDCDAERAACRGEAQDAFKQANEDCKVTKRLCHDNCGLADDEQCVARCTRDAGQCLKADKRTEQSCRRDCPSGRERRACGKLCQASRFVQDSACVATFTTCMGDCLPPPPPSSTGLE